MKWEYLIPVAQELDINIAALCAVIEVESNGKYFDPEGFPIILFEAHHFSKFTKGKYDVSHPSISSKTWNRSLYMKGWKLEKGRLELAASLDRQSALQSASWGAYQIMGFNYKACGFSNVQGFVNAQCVNELGQTNCFLKFIVSQKLDVPLRKLDWATFARRYNGSGYAANKYDVKLEAAFIKWAKYIVVNQIASR